MSNEIQTDVIILGGSMAASITALALTAQGLSVALVDSGQHPRFALGESLLKPTVYWMRLLAERFNVPQLNVLANVEKLGEKVAMSSGIKKSFGFVKHEPGENKVSEQWWANIPVSYEEDVSEAHLFRQDTDAWLFNEAVRECSAVIPGAKIENLEITSDGVLLDLADIHLQAQYIVDCTSAKSLVADKFNLREEPCRFKSRSRSIFTHMIGVVPFDECESAPQPALDWHEGTLHHLLDDAWVWVIPFDNQPGSRNPLVSIGVTYNSERWPQNDLTPEQEWDHLLETYPALKRQFGNAKPVRPWVSTGTLQYSSRQAFGDRYCLLGQSYGGIDALYSRGLLNTMQCIYLVVNKLLSNWDHPATLSQSFGPLKNLQDGLLEVNDLLTHGSYCASGSPLLTTWWLSIWTLVEQRSIAHVQPAFQAAIASKPDGAEVNWASVDAEFSNGTCIANQSLLLDFMRPAVELTEAFRRRETDENCVDKALTELAIPLRQIGFDPPRYSRLLKTFGFDQYARILLQTEQKLVGVVEQIDRNLCLNRSLRNHLGVKCVVRLISDALIAWAREANKSKTESCCHFGSTEDLLREQLGAISQKVIPDPAKRLSIQTALNCIHAVSYSEADGSVDPSDENMACLLQTTEPGKSTMVYSKPITSEWPDERVEYQICCSEDDRSWRLTCVVDPQIFNLTA